MGVLPATNIENKPKATAKNLQFVKQLDKLIDNAEHVSESITSADVTHTKKRFNFELLTLRTNYIQRYDWYDTIFEENGKYGTKDVTGKVLLPAKYDGIGELYHQIYDGNIPRAAQLNGKYGLLLADGRGLEILPFEYDEISYLSILPYYIVKKGNKCGIVRKDGKVIAPCIIDEICHINGNCIIFKVNVKYGLIDCSCGDLYVEPQFDNVEIVDSEQPYTVTKDGVEGCVNKKGEFMTAEESQDYCGYLIGEFFPKIYEE